MIDYEKSRNCVDNNICYSCDTYLASTVNTINYFFYSKKNNHTSYRQKVLAALCDECFDKQFSNKELIDSYEQTCNFCKKPVKDASHYSIIRLNDNSLYTSNFHKSCWEYSAGKDWIVDEDILKNKNK